MGNSFVDALDAERKLKLQRAKQDHKDEAAFARKCDEFFSPILMLLDEMHAVGVQFDGQSSPPAAECRLYPHRVDIRLGPGATMHGDITWLTIVLSAMSDEPDQMQLAWNGHLRCGNTVTNEFTTARLDDFRDWLAKIVAEYEDKQNSSDLPDAEPKGQNQRTVDLKRLNASERGEGSVNEVDQLQVLDRDSRPRSDVEKGHKSKPTATQVGATVHVGSATSRSLLLRATLADGRQPTWFLEPGKRFTIGNADGNAIILDQDGTVDRVHAMVKFDDKGLPKLCCSEPHNYFYVDESPLQELSLEPGVQFRIGSARFDCLASDPDASLSALHLASAEEVLSSLSSIVQSGLMPSQGSVKLNDRETVPPIGRPIDEGLRGLRYELKTPCFLAIFFGLWIWFDHGDLLSRTLRGAGLSFLWCVGIATVYGSLMGVYFWVFHFGVIPRWSLLGVVASVVIGWLTGYWSAVFAVFGVLFSLAGLIKGLWWLLPKVAEDALSRGRIAMMVFKEMESNDEQRRSSYAPDLWYFWARTFLEHRLSMLRGPSPPHAFRTAIAFYRESVRLAPGLSTASESRRLEEEAWNLLAQQASTK